MLFNITRIQVCLFLFVVVLSINSSHSMDIVSEASEPPPTSWASSANFKLSNKVAIDIKTGLNSDELMEWHMSQAPQLADVYSNYQPGSGRNVAKALCSIVYTTGANDLCINHYPFQRVYINGWHVQDKKVKKNALFRMRLDDSSKGTTELESIVSLYNILSIATKDQNNDYIQTLMDDKLITGFDRPTDLIIQTGKHWNEHKSQPPFIRNLKEKQTHTEKTILIDIDIYINDIIKKISVPEKCTINYFIINFASYRYMCPSCKGMNYKDDPLFNLLMRIREKVNIAFGREEEQDINIKVIFSGIARGSEDNMPDFLSSRTPINLEEDRNRILYLIQNPLRPFSSEEVKGGKPTGNMTTVLGINSNYLAYSGRNW